MAAQPASNSSGGLAEPFALSFDGPEGSDFEIARDGNAVWCTRRAGANVSVSMSQLEATLALDRSLMSGNLGTLKYKVIASAQAGVFSLGGDLAFFCRCIEQSDRAALSTYALLAARAVWANLSGFGARRIQSIAVVEGEAQGGGFEAALSCDFLIAERGVYFGFPESLFGLFPGMGGRALLETKLEPAVADKILLGAHRYSAEFLHEIGVVDYLTAPGEARKLAQTICALKATVDNNPKRKERREALTFGRLVTGVEEWVETAMSLTERNLRAMRYLLSAQQQRA